MFSVFLTGEGACPVVSDFATRCRVRWWGWGPIPCSSRSIHQMAKISQQQFLHKNFLAKKFLSRGCGWYASCGHAEGLSCSHISAVTILLTISLLPTHGSVSEGNVFSLSVNRRGGPRDWTEGDPPTRPGTGQAPPTGPGTG